MGDRKQPPVALMLLPLLALGAMLAVQYFAPPKAQTDEPNADQAAIQAPEDADGSPEEAVPAQIQEEMMTRMYGSGAAMVG